MVKQEGEMSKSKTIFKEIDVNPYSVTLWILITNNPHLECARLNQKYKGLGLKWPDDAAAWTEDFFYNDSYLTVIIDPKSYSVGLITHEVTHIKNMVYKHAGIKHDPNNDEPEAYLSGWIADEIYKAYTDYRKL